MKLRAKDLVRPDKLLFMGLKTLADLGENLYLTEKKQAKATAELAYIGEQKLDEIAVQLYTLNEESYLLDANVKEYHFLDDHQEGHHFWLNFHGIHEVPRIQEVADYVGMDRVTVRQILDTTLRPKVEEYENYLFLSVKSIVMEQREEMEVEQISFLVGDNHVISFQEQVGDHFEIIRKKIEEGLGFIRKRNSSYLLSQLLDAILENYFETIEEINHKILELEKRIYTSPSKSTLMALEAHKRAVHKIKKSLNPFKDILHSLVENDSKFIHQENLKFFRELSNSAQSASEEIESTARTLEGLSNIYFASLSQSMNETMKVLTTVATIFIPLTFIAGVYGMNFQNMPELGYKYGYFITWGIMFVLAIAMLIYFRRKKWI